MTLFQSILGTYGVPGFGIAGVFITLLAFGRLVPASIVRRQVKQADDNAKQWQAMAEAADRRADLAVQQNTEMLAAIRTLEVTMRGLGDS